MSIDSFDIATATKEEFLAAYQVLQEQFHQQLQIKDKKILALESRIQWLERQVFGIKSERLLPQDSTQVPLFELPKELEQTPPAETVTVTAFERSARKSPTIISEEKLRFGENVPVDEVVIFPKEIEGLSEDAYEVIGEKITERLCYIPIQYRVKRTIRKTVKLKEKLLTAPAPSAVIEKSFADVSFLSGLITDKFQYHLPLYRQHQRMQKAGVNVSTGQVTKLVHRSLELLEPIYNAVVSGIISSETVCMDETSIKAGRKKQGVMQTAWFWTVATDRQVAFVYSSSRSHQIVSQILGSHCKKLISDGYAAYSSYQKSRAIEKNGTTVIHAQCWAHVRRYFFEAREHSPPEAEKALLLIGELFEIERNAKNLELEAVAALRREKSGPIVEQFFSFLEQLWFNQMLNGTSLLGKAVQYAKNSEASLRQFISHPDIPLSNNQVERAIRPVAIGRKNWLFCWSEVGAKYAAIAFTLVECCKMHRIDPFEYLVDVLDRIDTHPAKDIHLLTPHLWIEHFSSKIHNAA